MSTGFFTIAVVTGLFVGEVLGADDSPPKDSPNDELGKLTIPVDAEEVQRAYRPLGDVVKRCQYLLNSEVVGERLFYKNGQIADEKLFRNKQIHGVWRQFHQNGKPFSERPYQLGLPDGTFRFWDANGELLGESELKKGTGVLHEFEKPELACGRDDTPYVKGKIHGKRRQWGRFDVTGENGCAVTTFKDGVMDGWSYLLHDDGTLLSYSYIKDDRLHGVMYRTARDGKCVEGYPQYRIAGKEVSEQQFREAAKTDKILALTLSSKPDIEETKPNEDGGK